MQTASTPSVARTPRTRVLALIAVAAAASAGAALMLDTAPLLRLFGRMHVAVVHFPIALLAVAAVADALFVRTRHERFRSAAQVCVWIGAAAAIAAAAMGWTLASQTSQPAALRATMDAHRWLGVATAAWSVMTLALMMAADARGTRRTALLYRCALYGGAALVGITGHLGGSLVYGPDYLTL